MGSTDIVVAEFGGAVNPLPVALFANRPILTDPQWTALADGLNQIGKLAADKGLRLCYHPHMGTGVMIGDEIDRLMEMTDAKLVHLLLDTGHLAFAGTDPLAVTVKHGKRIKHIHLKNVRQAIVDKVVTQNLSFEDGIEQGVFTVAGDPEGAIDFPPIFDALAEAGFEGWLVVEAEQDPAKALPLKYAKMAREYLRQQLGW
jgi:inosose dehydratase